MLAARAVRAHSLSGYPEVGSPCARQPSCPKSPVGRHPCVNRYPGSSPRYPSYSELRRAWVWTYAGVHDDDEYLSQEQSEQQQQQQQQQEQPPQQQQSQQQPQRQSQQQPPSPKEDTSLRHPSTSSRDTGLRGANAVLCGRCEQPVRVAELLRHLASCSGSSADGGQAQRGTAWGGAWGPAESEQQDAQHQAHQQEREHRQQQQQQQQQQWQNQPCEQASGCQGQTPCGPDAFSGDTIVFCSRCERPVRLLELLKHLLACPKFHASQRETQQSPPTRFSEERSPKPAQPCGGGGGVGGGCAGGCPRGAFGPQAPDETGGNSDAGGDEGTSVGGSPFCAWTPRGGGSSTPGASPSSPAPPCVPRPASAAPRQRSASFRTGPTSFPSRSPQPQYYPHRSTYTNFGGSPSFRRSSSSTRSGSYGSYHYSSSAGAGRSRSSAPAPGSMSPAPCAESLDGMARAHEDDWTRFESSGAVDIMYVDVPWPDAGSGRPNALLCHVLQRAEQASDSKAVLRKLQVRWHPDKWAQRYASRLCQRQAEHVLDRVKEISQVINGLKVT
mmetsp:Transcript_104899/g.301592  ORF Transcript_104899/g.301592 Transcript_104899/m.301592 type:complete len:556 (-) Transcript_104899:77-1744(-)